MGELLELAETVLTRAARGEQLEAYAVHRTETTVQAGTGGVVRRVGRAETRGLGVRLLSNARMGYASTADLSPEGLSDTVLRARHNASAADPDEAVALPEPEPAGESGPQWDESLGRTPLDIKIGLAADLANRVTRIDPRIRSLDTAEYADELLVTAVASTLGVQSEERHGYAELSTDAIGSMADGSVSDHSYAFSRDSAAFDVDALAGEAVLRTSRLMGSAAAHPVRSFVVLDSDVVGALLAAVGRACSGGPLSSGRSAFADLSGTLVAASEVDLADDGLCRGAAGASLVDGEGVPRRRTQLIGHGTLVGALHTTTTARASGGNARATGNAHRMTHRSPPQAAPVALVLDATCSVGELFAAAGDAAYLQQLSGSHSGISPLTGRINVGATGCRVRGGEFGGRLPTMALATSLHKFLSSIVMIADDLHAVPGYPVVASTVLCSPDWLDSGR